jgi:SAM-dependent methyltransferase
MQLKPIVVLKGAATFVPGVMRLACGGSGGTDSARYCYSTWLRHLVRVRAAGLPTEFDTVAELGPGDSLGIGLSAMLTGANRYFALDALAHARMSSNLATLDRLVELFSDRPDLPDVQEFPEIWPPVSSLRFPETILNHARLGTSMHPARIGAIRSAVRSGNADGLEIRYAAPWADPSVVRAESVDLVFSHAVLEHVEDIAATYEALYRWLKPGGAMSHQIDFRSHGLTRDWFGHWTISRRTWRVVRGRRPYLINRLPASVHIAAILSLGFELIDQLPLRKKPPRRHELAAEFRELSDEDLQTSALYVIARKPLHSAQV